ncbi:trichohyalin-like, partial [Sander lucioperca]|uniref:trichohyalin-like n=1 Tax=Sander lucioperca TaxID=283035 RepID=UPI00165383B9
MLLNILEELDDKEFSSFKWYLKNMGNIPPCHLEPADRHEIVDLLWLYGRQEAVDLRLSYGRQEAVNMTRECLMKIQRNDLAERLPATQEREEEEKLRKKQEEVEEELRRKREEVEEELRRKREEVEEELRRKREEEKLRKKREEEEKLRKKREEEKLRKKQIEEEKPRKKQEVEEKPRKKQVEEEKPRKKQEVEEKPRKKQVEEEKPRKKQKEEEKPRKKQEEEEEKFRTAAMLLNILEELDDKEFSSFKWYLKNMGNIPPCQLDPADRHKTVDLMQSYDRQEAVKMTRECLMDIQRKDLAERLPATQEEEKLRKKKDEVKLRRKQEEEEKLRTAAMLLNILEELDDKEFSSFKWYLKNMTKIQPCHLDPADRHKTVDLMQSYGRQEAVKMTRECLMKIQRNDLVESLPATQGSAVPMQRPHAHLLRPAVAHDVFPSGSGEERGEGEEGGEGREERTEGEEGGE